MIIWDLDDTFWQGTLAEGTMELVVEHCNFIKQLIDHGIMCSICSKNDFDATATAFNDLPNGKELFDLFVFKSINWEPKGARIKQIITDAGLRPANVLFIDDNEINLNEAKFYNDNLLVCLPSEIPDLIKQIGSITKEDKEHKRLKQYKILEQKTADKQNMESNNDFLQESDIHVEIKHDCNKELDRLHELIIRTNQLNFTKDRCSRDDLVQLLKKKYIESGYVHVYDKYGDYGIVGFYVMDVKSKKLLHFVFSCRTLGMGIEQYVYAKLGFPKLVTVGEVANPVCINKYITYIHEGKNKVKQNTKSKIQILLKGPCDLQSTMPYLGHNVGIYTEFIHANEGRPSTVSQEHTQCVVDSKRLSSDYISEMLKNLPMLSLEDYTTTLFTDKYDVVVFSTLIDDQTGMYRDKKTKFIFPFANYRTPITDKKYDNLWLSEVYQNAYGFTPEDLSQFKTKYEFLGSLSKDKIVENLDFIRNNIKAETKLILILGSELKPSFEPEHFRDLHLRHQEINAAIKEWAKDKKNVSLINLTDIISSDNDYTDNINHFKRNIYFKLAQVIAREISDKMQVKKYTIPLYKQIKIDKVKKYVTKNGINYKQTRLCLSIFGLNIPLSKPKLKEYRGA